MKKTLNYILKTFIIVLILSISYSLEAQPPPPPGGATGIGNDSGNSQGGNAPIGGGLFILLGLGAAYGGKKLYDVRKEKLEE